MSMEKLRNLHALDDRVRADNQAQLPFLREAPKLTYYPCSQAARERSAARKRLARASGAAPAGTGAISNGSLQLELAHHDHPVTDGVGNDRAETCMDGPCCKSSRPARPAVTPLRPGSG